MPKQQIKSLIAQVKVLNDKYDEIRKINGENFNIFSILNMERYEVKTHSYFIYELINPKGSHDQKALFLKLFFKDVLKLELDKDVAFEKIQVKREDPTDEKRRIDFTIETDKRIIAIEMKIDASDQPNQLSDYSNFIKKHKPNKEQKLYYLTLFGTEASEKSSKGLEVEKDYHTISFRSEIYRWLKSCIEKSATIPTLREGLVHYKNLIQKITNQTSDRVGEEMENILKTPEDIKAAYTVAQELLPNILAKKEVEFWEALYEKIDKNNDWDIDYIKYEDDNSESIDYKSIAEYRKYKNDYFGITLSKMITDAIKIKCDVYKYNDENHIRMDFSVYKNNRLKNILLLDNIGFNRRIRKNYKWKFLTSEINFYGNDKPTYELFDMERFARLVNETAKEVNEQLKKILENESKIVKYINGDS